MFRTAPARAASYQAFEFAHALIAPLRWGAWGLKYQLDWPLNPFGRTMLGRNMAAGCELFENVTRRHGKPEFGIASTRIHGQPVAVREEVVLATPFCELRHFARDGAPADPKVLLIAPLSGHYATLLRDTVAAMLPEHDLYVTDWADARMVPADVGPFDLDDYIDTIIDFIRHIGPGAHVMAVCQPAVPALAAAALMAARGDPRQPASLILMGGPIDTRRNPTKVNELAQNRSLEWFEHTVIANVPFSYPGFGRRVYPGFVQLSGFTAMNLDSHLAAYRKQFDNLVKGDHDPAQRHRDFYDEYLSVMDLPAEYYLQTVKTVFQDHALPDGVMTHRGEPVDCAAIANTALMTVEGENDDICGLAQTEAALGLCPNVPADQKVHYVQAGVGHYGVFNGTRWRAEIQPRIRDFIRAIQSKRRGNS